ncbi:hypothetical protein D3C73_546740 [compost metagenome]
MGQNGSLRHTCAPGAELNHRRSMRPGQHMGSVPLGCIQLCGFQNPQAADAERGLHLIPRLCEAVVRDDQRPFQDLPYRLQLA